MFIWNYSESVRFSGLQLPNPVKSTQVRDLIPNTALSQCLKSSGRRTGTQQDVKAWDGTGHITPVTASS